MCFTELKSLGCVLQYAIEAYLFQKLVYAKTQRIHSTTYSKCLNQFVIKLRKSVKSGHIDRFDELEKLKTAETTLNICQIDGP